VSCERWIGHEPDGTGGNPCGAPAVERLVYVNPRIASHVHEEGAVDVCAGHLREHTAGHLLLTEGTAP
jgi:hypothetical protein